MQSDKVQLRLPGHSVAHLSRRDTHAHTHRSDLAARGAVPGVQGAREGSLDRAQECREKYWISKFLIPGIGLHPKIRRAVAIWLTIFSSAFGRGINPAQSSHRVASASLRGFPFSLTVSVVFFSSAGHGATGSTGQRD